MARALRLGTRASPLAMAQARLVRDALSAAHGWDPARIEIVATTTVGDQITDRPLAEIGGKALWTKPLDRALLAGEIDFAVHSMKDVETIRPPEIVIAAMPERADPRDRIIGAESIDALRHGARVGTSSPRRAAQLKRLRPDLEIVSFRGNVATRLAKLEAGEADATLLAAAGLDRLGQSEVGRGVGIETLLPACAQGAIGVECRAEDGDVRAALAAIDDRATHAAVAMERAFLAALGADCHSPVGAHARVEAGVLRLRGELLSGDGSEHVADSGENPQILAENLLSRAGSALRALFTG